MTITAPWGWLVVILALGGAGFIVLEVAAIWRDVRDAQNVLDAIRDEIDRLEDCGLHVRDPEQVEAAKLRHPSGWRAKRQLVAEVEDYLRRQGGQS